MMDKKNIQDIYELSPLQEGMLFHALYQPEDSAYFEQAQFSIKGSLDPALYEASWNQLVARHEVLRTRFLHKKVKQPLQVVLKQDVLTVDYRDLSHLEPTLQAPEIANYRTSNHQRSFDLSTDALLRIALFKLDHERYEVIWSFHHIIIDGWCQAILIDEFQTIYQALKHQQSPVLPTVTPYSRYIKWLRAQDKTQAITHWRELLAGYTEKLGLAQQSNGAGFAARYAELALSGEQTQQLERISREAKVTLSVVVKALWALTLCQQYKRSDVVFGETVSGRPEAIPGVERMVGLFINTLPVRIRLEAANFAALLQQVNEDAVEAKRFHFSSLAEVQAASPLKQDLIDHILVFENYPPERQEAQDLPFVIDQYQHEDHSSYHLTVQVFPDEKLSVKFIYNANACDESLITALSQTLEQVVCSVTEDKGLSAPLYELIPALNVSSTSRIPLSITASFTAEPMAEHLTPWATLFDLPLAVQFSPYNQVFQELLNKDSLFHQDNAVKVLLIRFEDWIRDIQGQRFSDYETVLTTNFSRLLVALDDYAGTMPVFTAVFPLSNVGSTETFGQELRALIANLNSEWCAFIENHRTLHLLDLRELATRFCIPEILDEKLDQLGHVPFSQGFMAAMAVQTVRGVHAWQKSPFKVIALDCDNTLWSGVCGEDSLQEIAISESYQAFQQFVLHCYQKGFLLVLCSKNSEADVWKVFDEHPDMLLKREHIIGHRINWEVKSRNLASLAQQLNLGVDSIIFIDDSGVECSEVMQNAPEVLTLHLPVDENQRMPFLQQVWAFDRFKVTAEDQQRTELYRAGQQREQFEESHQQQLDVFLKELDITVTMAPMADWQVPRLSQLTQRTNQFNFSTIRRSEAALIKLAQTPGYKLWAIEVDDAFGKYGLVGLVISKVETHRLVIDTFLLSCRVLGRQVESAILTGLRRYADGLSLNGPIVAEYIRTDRNQPVASFLSGNHWASQQEGNESASEYELALESIPAQTALAKLAFSAEVPADEPQQPDFPSSMNPDSPAHKPSAPSQNTIPFSGHVPSECHWAISLSNEQSLQHRAYYEVLIRNNEDDLLAYSHQQHALKKSGSDTKHVLAMPYSDTQKKMHKIWSDILNIENVSIDEDFIELGGHSLLAIRVVAAAQQVFERDISLENLFKYSTIEKLCAYIDTGESSVDVNFYQEASLPEDISPHEAIAFNGQVNKIFLTGSTGFLGCYLLEALLNASDAEIHCLVRAENQEQGFQRLKHKLCEFNLWKDQYTERLKPVVGELSEPRLGLSEETFRQLSETMDVIYHNGAIVNFVYAYQYLKAANVSGTVEVIRLASTKKLKPLHYISTIGVFTPHIFEAGEQVLITEDTLMKSPEELNNGYAESKWVAERLVTAAVEKGLPGYIYRPGEISSDSRTGFSNKNDMFATVLKGCLQLKKFPDASIDFEMVPVDYVASAIVYISLKANAVECLEKNTFHIVNSNPVNVGLIHTCLKAKGWQYDMLSYIEWRRSLLSSMMAGEKNEIAPLIQFFKEKNPFVEEVIMEFDQANTLGVLNSAIQCPIINEGIFMNYLSYLEETSYLSV